ncbi:polysaccharide deacetylase family protein [Paenibacillus sp. FSL K6-3182]|uniref:polysaccharide deacetylase family protein n=1 Tax=Paenibacillus sp. FSL K6-3182 TaxID=2921495 RepID=UPI0030CBF3BB
MKNRNEPISCVNTTMKCVALTFDIGWGGTMTTPVLNVLQANKINRATFFLSSPWVEKRAKLARKINAFGYEIGSHGDKHENYTEYSNRWIINEVKKSESKIRSVTGIKCKLFRTPNGDMNTRVTNVLSSLGYRTIYWSIDSKDWMNPGVSAIVQNATKNVRAGDIILLHASDSAKQTAKALPLIISILRRRGFHFVTVSQLLKLKQNH